MLIHLYRTHARIEATRAHHQRTSHIRARARSCAPIRADVRCRTPCVLLLLYLYGKNARAYCFPAIRRYAVRDLYKHAGDSVVAAHICISDGRHRRRRRRRRAKRDERGDVVNKSANVRSGPGSSSVRARARARTVRPGITRRSYHTSVRACVRARGVRACDRSISVLSSWLE